MPEYLHVQGLASLRRSLRAAEDMENLKSFQKGFKAAAQIVAVEARTRVPSRSGRAQESVRAGTSGNNAVVMGGKSAVPYYGWLDFGSRIPRTGQARRVGPWSGSGKGPTKGRFIYPALEAKREEVLAAIDQAVDATIREVGLGL